MGCHGYIYNYYYGFIVLMWVAMVTVYYARLPWLLLPHIYYYRYTCYISYSTVSMVTNM